MKGRASGAVRWRHCNGAERKRQEMAESGSNAPDVSQQNLQAQARRNENRNRRILLRLIAAGFEVGQQSNLGFWL